MEITLLIVFLSGLLVGITPCIILMLSTFGTSFVLTENKNKFLTISIGLILGMVFTYIVISILFLFLFQFLTVFYYFKYIFAGILITIGIWQIIECKKEKSAIFGTPTKIKTILKDFIDKNSGIYAFLVGIIFVLIKIPCLGLIYLALLYNLSTSPILIWFIVVYLVGMLIPIIIILALLRFGIESSKIEEFRVKNRIYLRILNGCVLIFLAFYLLILEDIIYLLFS